MDTRDDAELVTGVATGSEEALEALFHRHGGSVMALARHMLGSREEAEEVVQDTFLRLHRHADRFDPEQAALRTWLYAIARNLCLSRLRALNSRPRSVPELDPHDASFAATVGTSVDLLPGILVRDGLARLEHEERTLLRAAFYQGYSHADLAERHGLPLGTVKSKLRRGLLKLRSMLQDDVVSQDSRSGRSVPASRGEDGVSEGGMSKDGMSKDSGRRRDGPIGDGPIGDGPLGDGSVGDGSVGDGSVGDGSVAEERS